MVGSALCIVGKLDRIGGREMYRARGRRLNAPDHWRCEPRHSWLVVDFSHFTKHGTADTREVRSDTNE